MFVPEYWNPPTLFDRALAVVALAAKSLLGGLLFLGYYLVFVLAGVPLEELLFGFTFGLYWTGVYERLGWSRAEAPASTDGGTACSPRT